jgi:hypothetical protein
MPPNEDRSFYEEDLDAAEKAGEPWFSFEDWQKKHAEWDAEFHKILQTGQDNEDDIRF